MMRRKFSITEQAGTPVAVAAASVGGTALFTSSSHHTTNGVAAQASSSSLVGWSDPADARSSNTVVDIFLTFSATAGGGVDYVVQISSDGTNYFTKSSGTVATNSTVVVEDIDAPYVAVGSSLNAGAGSAGSALCTVSGERKMVRREQIERS